MLPVQNWYRLYEVMPMCTNNIRASLRENLSSGVANNIGADQPAHPRSQISAFFIRFWERNICKLTTGEILIH